MDQLLTVCRAITERDKHVKNVRRAEAEYEILPWYRFIRRNRLNSEITSLRAQIEACKEKISQDDVLHLAGLAGAKLWQDAAERVIPKKNPYGRASDEHFEEIFQLAVERRNDHALWIGARSFKLATLSDVRTTLTDSFIESNVRAIIAKRAEIAASMDFLHRSFTNSEGKQSLIVQHVASGLRACFTIKKPGLGSVYSKPYRIQSIDPNNPGPSGDWEKYVGLGIGVNLYQEAHRLMPDVRWMSSALSSYSPPLRKKLHAADPYIWNGSCSWCNERLEESRIYFWEAATQEFFTDHP